MSSSSPPRLRPSALDARALFAAAREDGPDDDARDAVFRKIAVATGVAAGTVVGLGALSAASTTPALAVSAAGAAAEAATSAGAAASSAASGATGTAFGIKLLALGVALGALTTALGVLLAVTVVRPDESRGAARTTAVATPATTTTGAKLAQPDARKRDEASSADSNANAGPSASGHASSNAAPDPNANANANAAASAGDTLAEEARVVTSARTALMAGDPAKALALVQGTRKLGTRALEPEELGLEARALRALGRADEAAATELLLRRRYPDHALAR